MVGNTSDWRYLVQTLLKSGLLLDLDHGTQDRLSAYSNLVSVQNVSLKGFSCFSTQKKNDFQAHFVHVPMVLQV